MPARSRPKKSPSVKKRARQSIKARLYNRAAESQVKTVVKKVLSAISGKDKEEITATMRAAVSAISKAASKGVLHRNTASRKISRLSKLADKVLRAEPAA